MTKTSCAVTDCNKTAITRGYCNPHYQRFYNYGDPLAGSRPVDAVPSSECGIEGCERKPRSTFAKYCEMHYTRIRRFGTAGDIEPLKTVNPNPICIVDGCDAKTDSRGLCPRHYTRLMRHGDSAIVYKRGFAPGDPNHPSRVELPGYSGAHQRIRSVRGNAFQYKCVECGRMAEQWAFIHERASIVIHSEQGPYSPNVDDYQPMCVPCHKAFDLIRLGKRRAD